MKEVFQNIFLKNRFFWCAGGLVVLFTAGFWWAPLFFVGQVALLLLVILCLVDGLLLFARPYRFRVRRHLPRVLSLGDEMDVKISLQNRNNLPLRIEVVDELPYQLQIRDFSKKVNLRPKRASISIIPFGQPPVELTSLVEFSFSFPRLLAY